MDDVCDFLFSQGPVGFPVMYKTCKCNYELVIPFSNRYRCSCGSAWRNPSITADPVDRGHVDSA